MINVMRHFQVFDPEKFNLPIHIIGCGSTGSRIACEVARLGIKDIHLWDDDKIEEHNIANQIFISKDIGEYKARQTAINIAKIVGEDVAIIHQEKVTNQPLSGVIFLLTDTMASRAEIWENSIKLNFGVPLMIETRMDSDNLRVYSISPVNLSEIKFWEGTLCTDDQAETSACGAQTTIGATAELIGGLAVWELLKWNKTQLTGYETIMALRPDPLLIHQKI